jgi:TolA-binding protein
MGKHRLYYSLLFLLCWAAQASADTESAEDAESSLTTLYILLAIVLALGLLLLVLIFMRKNRKKRERQTTEREQHLLTLKHENERLLEQNQQLEMEKNHLARQLSEQNAQQQTKQEETPEKNSAAASKTAPPLDPKWYAYRVDGNNGFTMSELSKNREGNYFVITPMDENRATYSLVNETDMQFSAAQNFASILQNACKFHNMPNEFKTGIEVVRPGLLGRKANEWVIIERLEIKFV